MKPFGAVVRLDRLKLLFLPAFAITIIGMRAMAWAWGDQGHEIIAIIAADNLPHSPRDQVAKILGTTSDTNSLEKAMAAASVRPDTEFRPQDRSTAPWHFIDVCLQDQKTDLAARCQGGACVTAKIDEYANRLKTGNYDRWGASGDLAFLIHLVGDIHQPCTPRRTRTKVATVLLWNPTHMRGISTRFGIRRWSTP